MIVLLIHLSINLKVMENYNTQNIKNKDNNRFWIGLILIFIGASFLIDNFNVYIPHWVFSWHSLMLLGGLIWGYKKGFAGSGWLIFVFIGGLATLDDILDGYIDISNIFWPGVFIGLGLLLMFRGKDIFKYNNQVFKCNKHGKSFDQTRTAPDSGGASDVTSNIDVLESVNVFGGSTQRVYSKSFKGGEVISVFGGCDIDLTQADFEGNITIEVIAIFGGCKILVPATWEVKSELAAVFGGVEDKRTQLPLTDIPPKRLTLTGVALFGGVNIRNY